MQHEEIVSQSQGHLQMASGHFGICFGDPGKVLSMLASFGATLDNGG